MNTKNKAIVCYFDFSIWLFNYEFMREAVR